MKEGHVKKRRQAIPRLSRQVQDGGPGLPNEGMPAVAAPATYGTGSIYGASLTTNQYRNNRPTQALNGDLAAEAASPHALPQVC